MERGGKRRKEESYKNSAVDWIMYLGISKRETDKKQRERVRQTRESGTSGADKSRHALRWENHHGDELN